MNRAIILLSVLLCFCSKSEACDRIQYDVFPPWGNAMSDVFIPTETPIVKSYISVENDDACLVVEINQRKNEHVSNGYYIDLVASSGVIIKLPPYAVYELDKAKSLSVYRFPVKLKKDEEVKVVLSVKATSNHGGAISPVLSESQRKH